MSVFTAISHPGLEPQWLCSQVLLPACSSAQQGPREPTLACGDPSVTPFPLSFCFSHHLPVSAGLPSLSRLTGEATTIFFHLLRKRNRNLKHL